MPPTKKKGKKNVEKIDESIVQDQNEPIVLQLPITNIRMDQLIESEHIQNILKYNPNIVDPQPYIPDNHFISANDSIINENVSPDNNENNQSDINNNVIETSNNCKVQCGINCFWCCHQILDVEYGMPIRYDVLHNNFTTYGSFCSLQCAAAYNYSVNMGCDRAWEIHSWIQLLGKKYGFKGPIRPAPSRYLLKMFHGPLTIEEFRKVHTNLIQTYVLNIPPFIHVSSQMESINTSFLDKEKPNRDIINGPNKRKSAISTKGELEQKMNLAFINESI
jgi:hypothetical protein